MTQTKAALGSKFSGNPDRIVAYAPASGVEAFASAVHAAAPMTLIDLEHNGVSGVFVKDVARRMDIPAQRMFDILGVPKATAEKKIAAGERLAGTGGRAALGLAVLVAMARGMVADSTHPQAGDFDAVKWLGRWLETPQPALGGRRPADLIDTPTGLEVVKRLLGSIESGAYQ